MSLLDPKPLSAILPKMAEALSLKISEDKAEIIRYINKYREYLYTKYDEFELFNNAFHCICVNDFKQLCVGDCNGCYQGITLPPDIVSVEAIWDYGQPLTLHSRWRESHTGVGVKGCRRIDATEMAETFPTERDLTEITSLKIFTELEQDEDKCVKVTVLTNHGKETTVTFKTISDGWAVSRIKAKKILSVSLPPDRAGAITLAQANGFVLSKYAPWEDIPNYRRFKLNANCRRTVLVQGVRRYRDIYFDHDIVEVGNGLVIEAAGKYFKFGENTADANELAVADKWLNEMKSLLNGLIARHRGNAIQDANPSQNYRIRNKTLPGYRKW